MRKFLLTDELIKKQAKSLKNASGLGYNQCINLISKDLGFKNWNVLNHELEEKELLELQHIVSIENIKRYSLIYKSFCIDDFCYFLNNLKKKDEYFYNEGLELLIFLAKSFKYFNFNYASFYEDILSYLNEINIFTLRELAAELKIKELEDQFKKTHLPSNNNKCLIDFTQQCAYCIQSVHRISFEDYTKKNLFVIQNIELTEENSISEKELYDVFHLKMEEKNISKKIQGQLRVLFAQYRALGIDKEIYSLNKLDSFIELSNKKLKVNEKFISNFFDKRFYEDKKVKEQERYKKCLYICT